MIVLLDLNFTLVSNSKEVMTCGKDYKVEVERYREWLVDFIRHHRVFLVTARPTRFKEDTVARIKELLGWTPEEVHFNNGSHKAPDWKRIVLRQLRERFPQETFVAIESNQFTRAMYTEEGVPCLKVDSPKGNRRCHRSLTENS